jgi:hypothetical protein
VLNIAQSPEERIALRLGREIRQSRLRRQGGKLYLVRLVVDSAPDEDQVVTACCTSRIDKYWSGA